MRSVTLLLFVFLVVSTAGGSDEWKDFVKAKAEAEGSELTPKTVSDLVPKTLIVERIEKEGQITFSSRGIRFDFGSWTIRDASYQQLEEIAQAIKDPKLAHIPFFFVDGHTCSIGSEHNNCVLSGRRAQSVLKYLVKEGKVPRNKLVSRGFGENAPVASNETEDGRQTNRRVVLKAGGPESHEDLRSECP